MSSKICSSCKEIKSKTEFGKSSGRKDGLNVYCKSCAKEKSKISLTKTNLKPKLKLVNKFCKNCSTDKPIEDFYKNKNSLDGLGTYCKSCDKQIRKNNYDGMKLKEKKVPEEKKCNICNEIKHKSYFYTANTSSDGLNKVCIECCKKFSVEYLSSNRKRNLGANPLNIEKIVCSLCKQEKSIENFHKNVTAYHGYNHRCKECTNEEQKSFYKKYFLNNRSKVLEKSRSYKKSDKGRLTGRLSNRRRRARLKQNYHDKYNENEVYEQFDYRCFNCDSEENLTIDHIVPIFLGGHDAEYNLSVLCGKCNSSKGHKHPKIFYTEEKIKLLEDTKNQRI